MTFDEYQQLAQRTNGLHGLAYLALGITGESGEVAEHIKKYVYHGHPLDKAALAKELGDVLWYLSVMASELGISLDNIARDNIAKLRKRYPEGFSEERSRERPGDSKAADWPDPIIIEIVCERCGGKSTDLSGAPWRWVGDGWKHQCEQASRERGE